MKIKQLNKIYNRHNKNLNFRSRTTNTTNINILLNRVRQKNKSNLKLARRYTLLLLNELAYRTTWITRTRKVFPIQVCLCTVSPYESSQHPTSTPSRGVGICTSKQFPTYFNYSLKIRVVPHRGIMELKSLLVVWRDGTCAIVKGEREG